MQNLWENPKLIESYRWLMWCEIIRKIIIIKLHTENNSILKECNRKNCRFYGGVTILWIPRTKAMQTKMFRPQNKNIFNKQIIILCRLQTHTHTHNDDDIHIFVRLLVGENCIICIPVRNKAILHAHHRRTTEGRAE